MNRSSQRWFAKAKRWALMCSVLLLMSLLSAAASARVLPSHRHCFCAGVDGCEDHDEQIVWTEWTSTTSLPSATGNYYLTGNVSCSTWDPPSNVRVCLNGYTVVCSIKNESAGTLGDLTITDCAQVPGTLTAPEGVAPISCTQGNSLKLYRISIKGQNARGISLIGKDRGALPTVSLWDVHISGCTTGIYADPGERTTAPSIEFHSGEITGCSASGVWMYGGRMEMYGGKIHSNRSSGNGGGVRLEADGKRPVFVLRGGEISQNTAVRSGGGISMDYQTGTDYYSSVAIFGGKISQNTAGQSGGGIYKNYYNHLTLSGGVITQNSAPLGSGCHVKVANYPNPVNDVVTGAPVVSGNTNDNLYLEGSNASLILKPASQLQSGASIGISTSVKPTQGSPVKVASPADEDDHSYFFSDDKAYAIINEDGQVKLALAQEAPSAPVTAPAAQTGLVYNGAEQTGVLEGEGYILTGHKAVNAGSYTAEAVLKDGFVWADGTTAAKTIGWSIARAQMSYTAPASNVNLSYNGTEQNLIMGGSCANGTLYFRLGEDGEWTADAPMAVNKGSYQVYYFIKADGNHDDVGSQTEPRGPIACQIACAAISPTVTISGWTYGQTPNAPQISTNPGNGVVTYTYYTDEACTQLTSAGHGAPYEGGQPANAGVYWVVANVAEAGNYASAQTPAASFTILHGFAPAAPGGLSGIAPSAYGADDGSIAGVDETMEYSVDGENYLPCTGSTIPGLSAGVYYVRCKATANMQAGLPAEVTVPEGPKALQGTVTITGVQKFGQTITAQLENSNATGTLSYQWLCGGEVISDQPTCTLTLNEIGQTLTCVITSSAETGSLSGMTGVIGKADGPAAPEGLAAQDASAHGADDGSITGVDETMEYSVDGENYLPCTGDVLSGLGAGTYYVRYQETATHQAGAAAAAVVGQPPAAPPVIGVEVSPSSTIVQGKAVITTLTIGRGLTDLSANNFAALSVDGRRVAPGTDTFDVRTGSVIVQLHPAYLNTLSLGQHLVQVDLRGGVYEGCSVEAQLTVVAEAQPIPPQTGDTASPAAWAALMGMAALLGAMLTGKRRKA